jgi:hypothetical protein
MITNSTFKHGQSRPLPEYRGNSDKALIKHRILEMDLLEGAADLRLIRHHSREAAGTLTSHVSDWDWMLGYLGRMDIANRARRLIMCCRVRTEPVFHALARELDPGRINQSRYEAAEKKALDEIAKIQRHYNAMKAMSSPYIRRKLRQEESPQLKAVLEAFRDELVEWVKDVEDALPLTRHRP